MSLLLEALKKAELAKQASKPSQEAAAPSPAREPEAASPVMTREKLPDISQPLQILTDDLPSARGQRPPLELSKTVAEPVVESVAPAAVTPAPPPPPIAEAGRREAARQVFEAKEMEYNPKRPFQITVGLLILAGAGYGGYVWWQTQPRYSVSASAVQAASKSAAAAPPVQSAQAPAAPADQAAPAATTGPAPAASPAGTPAPAEAAPSARAPEAGPAAAAKAPVFVRGGSPASTSAVAASSAAAQRPAAAPAQQSRAGTPTVSVTPPSAQTDPVIERAYEAFQQGDLAAARTNYESALQRDATSRDALLGLAAIDVRMREFALAAARYEKLLELDPRDGFAQAGMLALRRQADPVQSESRIKTLIATNPETTPLYFNLGNEYAQQSLWSEAQAAYFKAYSTDPDNPDYAYNLAVSLDHLRQGRQALEYYERALILAQKRPSGFDREQTQSRIRELRRE